MRIQFQRSALAGIAGVTFILLLTSFSLKRGGDSYTISVNGKQVIQYYVYSKDALPNLTLNANMQDELSVFYNECGKIGTSRTLSVRDDEGRILKEWKYANALGEHSPMTVKTKDISARANIALYYTSDEVTTPRKLVTLVVGSPSSASR